MIRAFRLEVSTRSGENTDVYLICHTIIYQELSMQFPSKGSSAYSAVSQRQPLFLFLMHVRNEPERRL